MADEVILAETLGRINAPNEVRREQMRSLVGKIFPQLKSDTRKQLFDSIADWLEATNEQNPIVDENPVISDKLVSAPNRQGEITQATGQN